MSSSEPASHTYGRLLLALAIPVVGFLFLGLTGFVPLLIVSQGTPAGLAIIGYCVAVGGFLCWIGRRSGVVLLVGLLLLGFGIWCGIRWVSAVV
jgi:hypothetical protein